MPPEQWTEQVLPGAQAVTQPPFEHATSQVAPAGHDVLQPPLEQATSHWPTPQVVRQWPLEHCELQSPLDAQVLSQYPFEHCRTQGAVVQVFAQWPAEHMQGEPEHIMGVSMPPSKGKGTIVLPPSIVPPPSPWVALPPQPTKQKSTKRNGRQRETMRTNPIIQAWPIRQRSCRIKRSAMRANAGAASVPPL